MFSVAEWIRGNRIKRGWPAEELARRVEASLGSVSRWERNKHKPNLDQFRRLCLEFGESADDALGLRRARIRRRSRAVTPAVS